MEQANILTGTVKLFKVMGECRTLLQLFMASTAD